MWLTPQAPIATPPAVDRYYLLCIESGPVSEHLMTGYSTLATDSRTDNYDTERLYEHPVRYLTHHFSMHCLAHAANSRREPRI